MLSRLRGMGGNLVLSLAALGIGVAAFVFNLALSAAARPPEAEFLVAARDIQPGEVIAEKDLRTVTGYDDPLSRSYLRADERERAVGRTVAVFLPAGAPVPRGALLELDPELRLSAAISGTGMVLFPLRLDAQNIVAPDWRQIRPGDRIALTVVIRNRPTEIETGGPVGLETPAPAPKPAATPTPTPTPLPVGVAEALERLRPPLAKDFFPGGLWVVWVGVPGAPVSPADETGGEQGLFEAAAAGPEAPLLVLAVPDGSRELLALALAVGDPVILTLLPRPGEDKPTPGLSFMDLEEWLRRQRSLTIEGTSEGSP